MSESVVPRYYLVYFPVCSKSHFLLIFDNKQVILFVCFNTVSPFLFLTLALFFEKHISNPLFVAFDTEIKLH